MYVYPADIIRLVEGTRFNAHAYPTTYRSTTTLTQNIIAEVMSRLADVISRVEAWMTSNRLRLNPS